MRYARTALLLAAALGLTSPATAAYAQVGADHGYSYRHLPPKGHLPRRAPRVGMSIPAGYQAAAPLPTSNCFLTNFENTGASHPMYVTMCGP
jgi:hypothetical protein